MAEVTRWQRALREAQVPVTAAMKRLGFRNFGNYYNRPAADGLVQVIGFQSGRAVSIFHGNFTVNLGVYIPPLAELEGNATKSRGIGDSRCEVRSRLSAVAGAGEDKWWPLDESAAKTGVRLVDMLEHHGVPFLDRYATYSAIIERFETDGHLPFHNPARSALAIAVIHWARGEAEQSRKCFEAARRIPSHNRGFDSYVVSIQERCGVR